MIGRGPEGFAAHLLCSRRAAAARPPWDRVRGRLSGVPQVAARRGDPGQGQRIGGRCRAHRPGPFVPALRHPGRRWGEVADGQWQRRPQDPWEAR